MNILLISPHSSPAENETRYVSPALGVHRLAGYLTECGHYAEAFDPNMHDMGIGVGLDEKLRERVWDYVGVSCLEETLAQDIANMWTVSRIIPSAMIIAGGIEAQYNYQTILDKTPCDIVVLGEGERTMALICGEAMPINEIPGIVVKTEPAEPLSRREFAAATSAIDWEGIDYETYWRYYVAKYGDAITDEIRDQIFTVRVYSRNRCGFACKFCTSTHHLPDACGHNVRSYGLDANELCDIVERILEAHPQTRTIYLTSDDFCLNKPGVLAFCHAVCRRGLNGRVSFMAFARATDLDADMLSAMKAANFRRLNIGAESFSDRVLQEVGKQCTAADIMRALLLVKASGIQAFITAMLVTPQSTLSDVAVTLDTIDDLLDHDCFTFGLAPAVRPTKGSEFYEMYDDFETQILTIDAPGRRPLTLKKHTRIYASDPAVRRVQMLYYEREAEYLEEYRKKHLVIHGTYASVASAQVALMRECIRQAKEDG